MANLKGKSILIIGGTGGLGLSAARHFERSGARVAVTGRDADRVKEAASLLADTALAIQADASQSVEAERVIASVLEKFGRVDGLYHVAGGSGRGFGDGPLHAMSDKGWDFTLRLNLDSVFYSNRAALRQFLKQGGGGAILNCASVLGFSPSPRHFATHAYATAKAAILGLGRAAAAHYAKDNIRVNTLAPALVATPMSQRAQGNEEIMDFIHTKQPLDGGRIGRPEDLDEAAAYLLSDEARFVTGQVLAVDGGWCVSEGGA